MNRRPVVAATTRRFPSWLAVIAVAAAIGACNKGADSADGRSVIRFSGYAGNPAETDLMKKLTADFNASQSEIKAVYEPVPGQYYPKMLTMLVSRTAPDVFYLDILYFKPFLSKNILRPVDDYMAKSGLRREDFIPALIDAFTDQGTTFGIPKDFNAYGLFYSKAAFDAKGMPYPDSTWDLEKLRSTAKALTSRTGGKNRYGFALTHDNIDRYMPIARSFGAKLFDAEGRCAMDRTPALEAMDYYTGLKKQDGSAIYPSEVGSNWTGDAFGRGDAAMVYEGGWLIPYLADSFPGLRYGVAELPAGPEGPSNFLFTVAYVIPQTSKHPEAAWKLIEYLTSARSQAQVTFALPSRKAESARYAERHPEYRPILSGAAYARPYEFGPKGDRVKDRLGVAVQEIFLGAKDAETALSDACADIDRLTKL